MNDGGGAEMQRCSNRGVQDCESAGLAFRMQVLNPADTGCILPCDSCCLGTTGGTEHMLRERAKQRITRSTTSTHSSTQDPHASFPGFLSPWSEPIQILLRALHQEGRIKCDIHLLQRCVVCRSRAVQKAISKLCTEMQWDKLPLTMHALRV